MGILPKMKLSTGFLFLQLTAAFPDTRQRRELINGSFSDNVISAVDRFAVVNDDSDVEERGKGKKKNKGDKKKDKGKKDKKNKDKKGEKENKKKDKESKKKEKKEKKDKKKNKKAAKSVEKAAKEAENEKKNALREINCEKEEAALKPLQPLLSPDDTPGLDASDKVKCKKRNKEKAKEAAKEMKEVNKEDAKEQKKNDEKTYNDKFNEIISSGEERSHEN